MRRLPIGLLAGIASLAAGSVTRMAGAAGAPPPAGQAGRRAPGQRADRPHRGRIDRERHRPRRSRQRPGADPADQLRGAVVDRDDMAALLQRIAESPCRSASGSVRPGPGCMAPRPRCSPSPTSPAWRRGPGSAHGGPSSLTEDPLVVLGAPRSRTATGGCRDARAGGVQAAHLRRGHPDDPQHALGARRVHRAERDPRDGHRGRDQDDGTVQRRRRPRCASRSCR